MGRFSLPQTEYKISKESAEKLVRDLLSYYRIDIDAIQDKSTKQSVEGACDKLVGYYRRGYVENSRTDKGLSVKQHLQEAPGDVKEIAYGKMTGKAKIATDGFGTDDRYQRIYAMLDHMSGSVSGTIENLSGVDLAVAEDLGVLFLLG